MISWKIRAELAELSVIMRKINKKGCQINLKKHSSYPVGQVSSAVLQAPERRSLTRQKLTWHVSDRSVFIWSRLNWKLLKLQLTALTWLGVDDFSEVWTIFAPQPSSITLKVWLWVSEAITQSCKWNKTGNSSEKSSFHSTESELQILKIKK